MKLEFWKIPGLAIHHGFTIVDIVARPGVIEMHVQNLEVEGLKAKITFRDHAGFLVNDEFGMEGYIVDSPARRGLGGATFFIASDSEFKLLLSRGAVEPK